MWQKNVLYLDYNASAGISLGVRKALTDSLNDESHWVANPSSSHQLGQREGAVARGALSSVARSLGGVDPAELVLTSSGTESNQAVLSTLARSCENLWIGAGEHPASRDFIPVLLERNSDLKIETIPLRENGAYDFSSLESMLRSVAPGRMTGSPARPVGISLTWANNETGVLLDLLELSRVVESSGIVCLIHLDGAQAWGKLPIDLKMTPAQYVTFSSHKIGAPAGAGLIWKRAHVPFYPTVVGDSFGGRRGGSMNLLCLRGLGVAAEQVDPVRFHRVTEALRDRFESELRSRIPGVRIFGSEVPRVGNTSRFGFEGFSRYSDWVELLDLEGFAVSRGSACKSGAPEASAVLKAMSVPGEVALNSIRMSMGPNQTWEDLESFLGALCAIHEKKRMSF